MNAYKEGFERPELEELLIAISDLLLETVPIHALIGGVAVMYYGQRAYTRDVDFLVVYGPGDKDRLIADAERRGWRVERKGDWHLRVHCLGKFADLVDAEVELQVQAARLAHVVPTDAGIVRIAPLEHLVALKVLAGRPRDRADVVVLYDEHPELDVARVNELLMPFDEVWTP